MMDGSLWPRKDDMKFRLEWVAPRLAKARDQQLEVLKEKRRLAHQVDRLERLVTHRDLQYYRALATNNRKYCDKRQRMLKEAHERLAQARQKLEKAA